MSHVLIVDDDPVNRSLLATLVRHLGHEPREAADGAEALAIAHATPPVLVVSDILMPTMDGYEFVHRLRADPALAATEVIFYSAHYHELQARNLAAACGVNRVLVKPCEPEVLLAEIEQAVARGQRPAHVPAPAPAPTAADAFDREHLQLLTNKLSENVEELQRANRQLAALTALNLHLASERDPQDLLDQVCRGARALTGAKWAVLAVNGSEYGRSYHACAGITLERARELTPPALDRGPLGLVRREGRSRRFAVRDADPVAAGLPAGYPRIDAALAVPVSSPAKTYGWICLADKLGANGFSAEDQQLLETLGAQVGRIYENGSLTARARRDAEQLRREVLERERAAEELRQSEERFRQLAESIDEVFWLSDVAKRAILYVSPSYDHVWGRSSAALYRSPADWHLAIHPADRPRVVDAARRLQASGGYDEEYRILRPDGVLRWIRDRAFPVSNADGKVVRIAGVAEDITERRRMQEELRARERALHRAQVMARLSHAVTGPAGAIEGWPDTLPPLLGRAADTIPTDLRGWMTLLHPDDRARFRERIIAIAEQPARLELEYRMLRDDGRVMHVRHVIEPIVDALEPDQTRHWFHTLQDVTQHREAEERIRRLNRVYAVLSGINTLIVRVRDCDSLFREACRITVQQGQFLSAWIGVVDAGRGLLLPAAAEGFPFDFRARFADGVPIEATDGAQDILALRALRAGQPLFANDLSGEPNLANLDWHIQHGTRSLAALPLMIEGKAVGVLSLISAEEGFFDAAEIELLRELAGDIAFAIDHITKAARLDYLAYHDEVTGLLNRALFLDRAAQHLRTRAGSRHPIALVLIDVERFRSVNDSLGRHAGDELLRHVAARIRESGVGMDVARVGPNCFGLLVRDAQEAEGVALEVEGLLRTSFGSDFVIDGTELRIAARAGVALFPGDGEDADTLLRSAEAALGRAKHSAENLLFYAPEMNQRVAEALRLESRLRVALEQGQYLLHYQPKADLRTGLLTGAEALIRWKDPESGLVPPGEFIPILEDTGMIYEVGRWAIAQALRDAARWRAAGHAPVRIAVNVSPLQLRHRNFLPELERIVDGDPLAATVLELEITESLVMEDVERSTECLERIRAMGISVAVDDFGTGYSSLSHLARLPVDTIKIDRSFVIEMVERPQSQVVVATIVSLAHSLDLVVIAEGVETPEQAELLRALRCDQMQGYLLGRPVPAEDFHRGSPGTGV